LKLFVASAFALAVAQAVQAAPAPLALSGGWSRPAAAGTNGVGYLSIANRGAKPDAVVAVETPLASRVDMHSMSMAGGVMSMQKVDRVAVPAGGQAAFGPGGHHMMLMGLTRALKVGDKVPLTVTFASGAKLKADLTVALGPPSS